MNPGGGGTWKRIDQRANLHKQGRLSQAEGRWLVCRIHKTFSEDRKERALQARHAIMAALKDEDLRKAYGTLHVWHKECNPEVLRSGVTARWRTSRASGRLSTRSAPLLANVSPPALSALRSRTRLGHATHV